MKSLTLLVQSLLEDIEQGCGTSTTRDFVTITRRVEHEGLAFLTLTLPRFCQDFERSLEESKIDSSRFFGFKRQKRGALPRFLGGLLSLVFDSQTGVLLDSPNVCAIADIRQICLMFKKVKLECSVERTEATYDQFVKTEHELTCKEASLSSSLREEFKSISRLIWSDSNLDRPIFQAIETRIQNYDHMPKHGPGATAERISGNRKYDLLRWHTRLEPWFPYDLYGCNRPDMVIDGQDSVEFVDPDAELPVRVISVPKTAKGPRIIAIEPVAMQYTQQSLLEILVPALEQHPHTRGAVNFTSQSINRAIAISASKEQNLATLDLSEASDRVLCSLVSDMLDGLPNLRDAIMACRSTRANVPGRGILHLSKFASMGSALCFPVESMVFYTILQLAIHRASNTRPCFNSIQSIKQVVRVYGDDLVCPVDMVHTVIAYLESFGLKVNAHKSFWNGKFRESCGMDAYDGACVTPTYVRELAPNGRQDCERIVSWTSLCNLLYKRGYWRAADYTRKVVESALGRKLRLVSDESAGLGLHSLPSDWYQRVTTSISGWCNDMQRFVTVAPVSISRPRPSKLDGYGALMKYFLKRGDDPFLDSKHLMRSGRPLHAHIKVRKVPSF